MLRKEKEGSFPASPSFWVWLGLGFMVPGIDWGLRPSSLRASERILRGSEGSA